MALSIRALKDELTPGFHWLTWRHGEEITASIGYHVQGYPPHAITLDYKVGGELEYYTVWLTTTPTPWGALRYWFECPHCNRRCGVVYVPPGARRFACRKCYDLTYRSNQEQHAGEGFESMLAYSMGDGITARDVRELLNPNPPNTKRRMAWELDFFQRRYNSQSLVEALGLGEPPQEYPGYKTSGELCELAGLSADNLAALDQARLLLPDTKTGLYRPKLIGWARKLAFLLAAGWAIPEIQAWARGRWSTPNPRCWPPDREAWRLNP